MNESCCVKFKEAVENRDISCTNWEGKTAYWIRGRPSFANDGDGYCDDMTDEFEISYCPFCGAELSA